MEWTHKNEKEIETDHALFAQGNLCPWGSVLVWGVRENVRDKNRAQLLSRNNIRSSERNGKLRVAESPETRRPYAVQF